MVDQLEFSTKSDVQLKSFDDRVMDAFLQFCKLRHKYPTIIGVSMWHIDYRTPLLETRLDRTLGPADFWLGAK